MSETVRRWALKFGTIIARKLRRGRARPDGRWHLDEVFVSVNGKQLYVWRAVDSEGEVLDILVQPRRDRQAALKLMRKLLKKQGIAPATIVTDKLRSYGSALRELGVAWRHDTGRCGSHLGRHHARQSAAPMVLLDGLRPDVRPGPPRYRLRAGDLRHHPAQAFKIGAVVRISVPDLISRVCVPKTSSALNW